jgi:cytidine deaminase
MNLSNAQKCVFEKAKEAANNSYSPYSHFKVGAALQTMNDNIYTGCNVENASYPCGICAEQTAIAKAISEGESVFKMLAIYVNSDKIFPPCGKCRQIIFEFAKDLVIIYGNDKLVKLTNIKALLPESFSL